MGKFGSINKAMTIQESFIYISEQNVEIENKVDILIDSLFRQKEKMESKMNELTALVSKLSEELKKVRCKLDDDVYII